MLLGYLLSVRIAICEDLPKILKMARECTEHMRSNGIDQWDDNYPGTVLALDIEAGQAFVWEVAGEIASCLTFNDEQEDEYAKINWTFQHGRIGVVHRLMVHPKFQGQGLAKKMMAFIESHAFTRGYHSIRLDAFPPNVGAMTLYDRLGYSRPAGKVCFRNREFAVFEKALSVCFKN
jgi:GNAT superfamily N-acetyltransferase